MYNINDMIQIRNILHDIYSTSSRNDKLTILKNHYHNELLQKVLLYVYDTNKVFGIGKKSLKLNNNNTAQNKSSRFTDIFSLLDYLMSVNLNDSIKTEVNNFLSSSPKEVRELYTKMILKDFKIGITSKTINKVWKGLIPSFELMRAKKFEDYEHKIKGEFILTTKLDGVRCAIIKENGKIRMVSRQNKPMIGYIDIEKEANLLPDNTLYDGELIAINNQNLHSKDLYRKTTEITGSKGVKTNIQFNCFDMIPLNEFYKGKSILPFIARKQTIQNLIKHYQFQWIVDVPILYQGSDKTIIMPLLNQVIQQGEEGLMLNLINGKYECKRTNVILKIKQFYSQDLKIIGFEEGDGALKGTLGSLLVDYKGYTVGVGTGFSQEQRLDIWNNKSNYLGKLAEIKYVAESSNEKGGVSLRFPVFQQLRLDKNEVSYS